MDRRAHSLASWVVPSLHPQLWRRYHPAHQPDQGGFLPAHAQEYAVDEGDAGTPAADQCAALQVQERSTADSARDDGALSRAPGQSARWVSADDCADPGVLRALCRTVGVRGDAKRPVHLLRLPFRYAPVDLRSGRPRPNVRAANPDGRIHVCAAEDDSDDGRSAAGEDDAAHARRLHLYVPESAVGARSLLDALQRAPDRSAALHGAQWKSGKAAGARCEEGVIP